MFTGIIREVGTVAGAVRRQGSLALVIGAPQVGPQLSVHESVCVDGVCLTVTSSSGTTFEALAVEETLAKTTLGALSKGARVNLEPALKLGDQLGGHIVQGHIDCVGRIVRITQRSGSWMLEVGFPAAYRRYLIPVGSIAIDGISLTVASLAKETFEVSIIPHTFENTTLNEAHAGQQVNLEFDLLGKYVESLLAGGKAGGALTVEKLAQWGYEP